MLLDKIRHPQPLAPIALHVNVYNLSPAAAYWSTPFVMLLLRPRRKKIIVSKHQPDAALGREARPFATCVSCTLASLDSQMPGVLHMR